MSSDEEGNAYSPLRHIEAKVYIAKWGEVRFRELTPEMEKHGYSSEDIYSGEGGQLAIVLYP